MHSAAVRHWAKEARMAGRRGVAGVLCAGAFAALLAGCAPDDQPEAAAPHASPPPANSAPAALPSAEGLPRFEDYPAGKVPGIEAPAPVDLSSHPEARRFRTMLTRSGAEGPNFAGRYTVVSWGCGTMCQQLMIVDAETGRVFEGLTVPLGAEYQLGSRLLVANPPAAVRENPCPVCETAYYVWDGERLERIASETSAPPAPPPAAVRPLVDSVRAEERPLLQGFAPAALRPAWDRLVITARDGTRRLFADEVVGEDLQRLHVFRGYLPAIGGYVVETIFVPEGGQYVLVDAATGRLTEIDGIPVPSPDGKRFVTASLDLVAGHQPNRIRIYRVEPDGPVLEWETEPREWGGANPAWNDPRTIRLDRAVVDWNTRPLEFRYSPMRLELSADGWKQGTPR